MSRNRYDRTDLFAPAPRLGPRFEPRPEPLDRLLDDDELFDLVRGDLARRHPETSSRGRPPTPVEVILRRLVVMRLSGWGFEQAEYLVNDSSVLRQVRRVYLERAPDDTAPIRRANTIGPEAVEKLDSRVVQLARSLKLTRGREPRVDTTAVETDIHSPTDSGPVGDGVRVVSRPLRRAGVAPGEAASGSEEAFRSRVRAVGKLSRPPHRIARRENERGREALKAAYARLVATARRTGLKAKGGSRSSRDMAMTRQLGGRPSDSGRSCLDSSEASGRPSGGPSRMARSPRRRSRSRCSSRTPR